MEKFNQLTPEKIQNSPFLKKDIANLQILDWLCGNPDRHFHNIFYKFDEAGNVTGVVGIDNDLSFEVLRITSWRMMVYHWKT